MEPRRILVVDDNHDAATSMAALLRFSGYQTMTAADGLEALNLAMQHKPDALLLDVGLPKMNGLDVCRQIRQSPYDPQPIIIAVTGWGQDRDRERSQEAGFDAHVVKPPDFDKMLALLDSLLEHRAAAIEAAIK
jgi:CheY-like chemotaxis protein